MKTKKILSAWIAAAMCAGALSNLALAESPLQMSIDTGSVLKTISGDMYGVSTDWCVDNNTVITDWETPDVSPNQNLVRAMNEYRLPVVRLGAGATKAFQWKEAVGPMEGRTEQTLWGLTGKITAGPLEVINAMEAIDENAQFTVTLNVLTDTAESAADFAEFLTGGQDTAWGAKRIAYGHAEPVPVKVYEIGNEVDYGDNAITVQEYIAACKQYIAAIKAKDPGAKFAVHTDTGIYNEYQLNETCTPWHVSILQDKQLAPEIDYIALHTYYSDYKNELMDAVMNGVQADIEKYTGSGRIKIYLSEHALAQYEKSQGIKTNPHNMDGVLETANILSRMAWHPGVEMAAYHGIDSANWANVTTDSSTKATMLNGIGNLLKMFKEYGIGDALRTSFTGFSNGTRSTVSGIAVRPAYDKLNLIFTNQDAQAKTVNITYSDGGKYKKVRETVISGSSLEADMSSEKKEIAVHKYDYAEGVLTASYTIPAFSACAVALEKETDGLQTVYQEDFSGGILPEGYSAVLNDPYGDLSVRVQNGALVLDGYSDVTDTLANSYVYLPESLNTLTSYTLDADITVNEYTNAPNGNGIIFGASANTGDILNGEANGNAVIWTSAGVSEYEADNGKATAIVSNVKNNFMEFAPGQKYHYTLAVSDKEVSFSINNKLVYTRGTGTVNAGGYIGFMFSDTDYAVDNIRITRRAGTAQIYEPFTYAENFDSVPNGHLPAGWEVMSGMAVAGVTDGELVLTVHEWWKPAAVKIGGLGTVKRDGLVMEADVTLDSQLNAARNSGVRNKAGFAYMMDADRMSSAGLLTYGISQDNPSRSQADFMEYGISGVNSSSGFNYPEGHNFLNKEKVHLKLEFSGDSTPSMFVDGTEVNYTKGTATQNTGTLGLMAMAATVRFDNIKITGEQQKTVTTELVEKEIDFNYEQSFDEIADGMLPDGWSRAGGEGTVQVSGGALEMSNSGWGTPSFLLFDLEKVSRQGLSMECDITRTAASTSMPGYAHAGLVYLYDGRFAETNAYGTDVRYSALYTDKPTDNSQQGETSDFGYKFQKLAGETFKRADLFGKDGDGLSGGKTVRLKIELGESDRLPKVYINGVEAPHGSNNQYNAQESNMGKIGLVVCDASVRIDNIRVSGKRTAFVSDYVSYEAEFAGGGRVFESEAKAIAAARLYEVIQNQRTDITAKANITAKMDENGNCTVTVTYGDFTQNLACRIESAELGTGFLYEENFETTQDGKLPAGWTMAGGSAAAAVKDGALEISNSGWGTPAFVLFDLERISRQGLTMECDITRTAASASMPGYAHAGLVYLYDGRFAETNAYGTDVRYSALYTDKPTDNSQQGETSDFGYKFQKLAGETFKRADLFGKDGDGLSGGKTVRLKIELGESDRLPKVYINGVEAPHASNKAYTALESGEGKIGLVVCDASVRIDNIKVRGYRHAGQAGSGTITVESTAVNNGVLSATVRAEADESAVQNGMLAAAAYENSTGRLAAVSQLRDWNPKEYPFYRASLILDGMTDYSPESYTVKVMAMDRNSLTPVCQFAQI